MVARCNHCHKENIPLQELALYKTRENSWELCCKECSKAQGLTWNETGSLNWLGHYAGIYSLETEQLLNNVKIAQGLRPEKTSDNERKYQRHDVTFKGYVTRSHDNKENSIVIKDLSKGGLKFISTTPFNTAELATVRITSKNSAEVIDTIEVVRVIKKAENSYEIGARFVKAVTIDDGNETTKKDKRHKLLLNLKYKSQNDDTAQEGAVLEIGKSSAILIVPQEFTKDSRLAIHVNSSSGVFAEQELSAIAKVKSCKHIYRQNHRLLVALGKTKIRKKSRVSSKLQ